MLVHLLALQCARSHGHSGRAFNMHAVACCKCIKAARMGSFPAPPLTDVRSPYQNSTSNNLKTISVIKLWLHPDLWSIQNAYFVLQKIIFPLTWPLIQCSGSNLFIARVKTPFLLQAPSNPSPRCRGLV